MMAVTPWGYRKHVRLALAIAYFSRAAFMIISLMLPPLLLWHLGPGPPLYSSLLILLPLIMLLGVFPSRALIQAIISYSQGGMIWWTASMSLISLISLLTLSSCHLRSSLLLKELPPFSCPVSVLILLILLPCQTVVIFALLMLRREKHLRRDTSYLASNSSAQMPRMPKEDHDHLEAVRRRVEQQEVRRRLEEEELEEAEVASWEEEELRQAREISLEEAQARMDEEIALWLREEEALQEALEESKREGIGKMQEEVVVTILASRNFYEVLQIEPKASKVEVRQAYRRLVVAVHPDKNSHAQAGEACAKLQQAYSTLGQASNRARYDHFLFSQ